MSQLLWRAAHTSFILVHEKKVKVRRWRKQKKSCRISYNTWHKLLFFFSLSLFWCVSCFFCLTQHWASYCIKLLLRKCIEHSDFRLILLNVVVPCATTFGMHVVSCICYLFFCFRVTKAYLWHCHPVTIDSSFQGSLCEDLRSNFHCLSLFQICRECRNAISIIGYHLSCLT